MILFLFWAADRMDVTSHGAASDVTEDTENKDSNQSDCIVTQPTANETLPYLSTGEAMRGCGEVRRSEVSDCSRAKTQKHWKATNYLRNIVSDNTLTTSCLPFYSSMWKKPNQKGKQEVIWSDVATVARLGQWQEKLATRSERISNSQRLRTRRTRACVSSSLRRTIAAKRTMEGPKLRFLHRPLQAGCKTWWNANVTTEINMFAASSKKRFSFYS